MTPFYRSLSLSALGLTLGASLAVAQSNNPGSTGGAAGSRVAEPTYPADHSNPALSPGKMHKGNSGSHAEKSPNVPGATGSAVVPGDRSTIGADRQATTQQKTGQTSPSN